MGTVLHKMLSSKVTGEELAEALGKLNFLYQFSKGFNSLFSDSYRFVQVGKRVDLPYEVTDELLAALAMVLTNGSAILATMDIKEFYRQFWQTD